MLFVIIDYEGLEAIEPMHLFPGGRLKDLPGPFFKPAPQVSITVVVQFGVLAELMPPWGPHGAGASIS